MTGTSAPDPRVPPEPGSLAQEAALLAAAVRAWLTAHGAAPESGQTAPASPAAAGWSDTAGGGRDAPRADGQAGSGPGSLGGGATDDDLLASWHGPTLGATGRHGPPWTVAPGETLCTGCPLCRLLATVGGSHADVVGHLLAALGSLAAAARAVWPPGGVPGQGAGDPRGDPPDPPASPRQHATQRTRSGRDRVQRIDIGD